MNSLYKIISRSVLMTSLIAAAASVNELFLYTDMAAGASPGLSHALSNDIR